MLSPVSILALASTFIHSVHSFIPTESDTQFGLGGSSHEKMSDESIKEIYEPYFNINKVTTSMDNARHEITKACAGVDDPLTLIDGVSEENLPPAHFDGESFAEGQQRLLDLIGKTKEALLAGKGSEARQYFGRSLHTLQDFYSHSNWIELLSMDPNDGSKDFPHPDIGNPLGKIIPRTPLNMPTCQRCHPPPGKSDPQNTDIITSCKGQYGPSILCQLKSHSSPAICDANLLPSLDASFTLTSGFYGFAEQQLLPETDPGVLFRLKPGKCSHGGSRDTTAIGNEGIAKDTKQDLVTPHWQFHERAADLSKQATREFLDTVKNQICDSTPSISCAPLRLLYGLGPSLAFAIDTTGSMGSIIASVISQAIAIVNKRRGTENEPSNYILAPFNDPDVPEPYSTMDADAFITEISGLGAFGGGDCPELALDGLMGAITRSSLGGDIFLWTDAGTKHLEIASTVATAAKNKKVKVFNFLFPSFCQSPVGFTQVSEESGGITFTAETLEAGDVVNIADRAIQANALDVFLIKVSNFGSVAFRRRRSLNVGSQTYEIPVDSSMTDLTFTLSGSPVNLTITRPDGAVVTNDTDDSVLTFSGGVLVGITNPTVGLWKATVTGSGNITLSVSGAGSTRLSSCEFLELRGDAHLGWFPVLDDPIPSSDAYLKCVLGGNIKTANFEFRSNNGDVLKSFSLLQGDGTKDGYSNTSYLGNVTVPDSTFIIYATGELTTGEKYLRVASRIYVIPPSNSTANHTTSRNTTTSTRHILYPTANATANFTSFPTCTDKSCRGVFPSIIESKCDDNYPTMAAPPPPVLTTTTRYVPCKTYITVSVITIVTKCPVTQTITIGTKEICETSEVESTQFITTTHLDICTVCSQHEPPPAAYPTAEQFPGAPSPKTATTPVVSGDSAKPSEPVSFKGMADSFRSNFALGSAMLIGVVMVLLI